MTEVLGSSPLLWRLNSGTIHLGKSIEQKLWKALTWCWFRCCNTANWRVNFEEWLAFKIQLHITEWIVSLSANLDQKSKIRSRSLKCLLEKNALLVFLALPSKLLENLDEKDVFGISHWSVRGKKNELRCKWIWLGKVFYRG